MVRTDAKDQKLDKFITITKPKETETTEKEVIAVKVVRPQETSSEKSVEESRNEEEKMEVDRQNEDKEKEKSTGTRREIRLASVKQLRKNIEERSHSGNMAN